MVNKDLDMAPRPTLERNGIALRLMSLLQFRLSGPIYIFTRSYKGFGIPESLHWLACMVVDER